jgi:hypothetical protein
MEIFRLKVCLAVALLVSLQLLVTKRFVALALLRLPSTIAHELSHWVVALALGCRPSGLSIIPKRLEDKSWRLGSVMFYPGTFSAGFVALAPLWVMGTASYWILWLRPVSPHLGTEVLAGVAGGLAAWAAPPSSTDWHVALRYPVGTALLLIAFALVLA